MRIYYRPISFRTEAPTNTAPFLSEGVSGTVILPAITSVTGINAGDKICLHNVCGEVVSNVAADVTCDMDSTFAEPIREPVDNDVAFAMTLSEPFKITSQEVSTESALANTWEDPYNTDVIATITGYVSRRKVKSFMTNDMILAASPVVIIEDCDGNLFRCSREGFSVAMSTSSADQIVISAQVSSNFKAFVL